MTTSPFSTLRAYLGRTLDASVNALAGVLEQVLGQLKRELDGRAICLLSNTSYVATDANTNEKTLATFTLAGGYLNNVDMYTFRLMLVGYKPNGHTDTIKLYFGGNVIHTVVSTANNALVSFTDFVMVNAGSCVSLLDNTLNTVDFTSDVEIKITATNGTAASGDFALRLALFELLKTLT